VNIRDWALVFFTVLAQMSVGSFVVLGVVHFFAIRKAGMEEADRLSDRALLAIIPTLALGLISSLFHLGTPMIAPLAVTNVGQSWLSREVLSGVLLFLVGALFVFLQWRKIGSFAMRNIVAWIAAFIGLALVFNMSHIYMLPTEPAWDTLATPFMFYTTTLLLGLLAMGTAMVASHARVTRDNPGCVEVQCVLLRGALRWIAIASVCLLGVEFLIYPMYLAALASGPSAAVESIAAMLSNHGLVLGVRLALVFIGAGILSVFIYQNALSPGRERIMGSLTYAAFGLVFVGEVLGRVLFYTSHVRIGLPI
jgi:anaerobic dimethyl sulfoxide reductase subunit C (anchor subunit)